MFITVLLPTPALLKYSVIQYTRRMLIPMPTPYESGSALKRPHEIWTMRTTDMQFKLLKIHILRTAPTQVHHFLLEPVQNL